MFLYREILLHKMLAVIARSLGHRKGPKVVYAGLALHLTRMQAEIWEWFLQGDVMLLDENKTKPTQIIASNGRIIGEMYKVLWKMQHQISSADPAEETYTSEERRYCCYLRLCVGIFHRAWEEEKEKLSERNMSHCLLCFPFRIYPSLCAKSVTLEGEKGSRGENLYKTSADVLEAQEGNPENKLLLLFFQMSFINWFRDRSPPPQQRRYSAPSIPSTSLNPVP